VDELTRGYIMTADASSVNHLDFDFVTGQTVATRVQASFPLRLMLPKHRTAAAQVRTSPQDRRYLRQRKTHA
jgi:hypothetical protein